MQLLGLLELFSTLFVYDSMNGFSNDYPTILVPITVKRKFLLLNQTLQLLEKIIDNFRQVATVFLCINSIKANNSSLYYG